MAKRRPARRNPPTEPVESGKEEPAGEKKYSVLVDWQLDQKLNMVLRRRKIKLSTLLREILADNIDRYINEALGRGECDEWGFSTADPLELKIQLSKETRQLLAEAARDHGVKAASVVQLILTRHLPKVAEEGRQLRTKLRDALGEANHHESGSVGPAQ